MIPYTYLDTGQCMARYPIIYHDAQQPDKAQKWLVLHEVKQRWNNNWQGGAQWRQYRGLVTWNPAVAEKHQAEFNVVYCPQYMNMHVSEPEMLPAWASRRGLCVVYGPPASIDGAIMAARYDVPLRLAELGLTVDAYGSMPAPQRPEYRPQWAALYRGPIPDGEKTTYLTRYRFSVCFENSRDPYYARGWVTEKIYDCLIAGTIPIYWGAPDITTYVPSEVFIDYRAYTSADELYRHLMGLSERELARMARAGRGFAETVDFGLYQRTFEALN